MKGIAIGLVGCTVLSAACSAGGEGDGRGSGPAPSSSDGSGTTMVASTEGDSELPPGTSSGEQSDTTFGCPFETYYPDVDEDGYGDEAYPVDACLQPPAHIPTGGDCDDTNPDVHPGIDELCDGFDNDCNGLVDEASASNASCAGCNLGLRDGHAYYYCGPGLQWEEARTFCAQFSADLVKIDDQAEQDFLLAEPLPAGAAIYIGLSDIETEGSFVWTDGTAPGFTAWNTGEPNDALEGEDCAQLAVPGGTWNDIGCTTAAVFVCESGG